MERLTEKHFKKADGFYVKCSGHCYKEDFSCEDCGEFEKLVDRLGQIEDILGNTYDLDHLRELVEADKDGRCVVLPCKVGTPVYWVVDVGVFECYFNLAAAEEVGKTVFLTREAAEAALAKEAFNAQL